MRIRSARRKQRRNNLKRQALAKQVRLQELALMKAANPRAVAVKLHDRLQNLGITHQRAMEFARNIHGFASSEQLSMHIAKVAALLR